MALQKPLFFNFVEGIDVEFSPTQDSMAIGQLIANGLGGIGVDMRGTTLANLAMPVNPTDGVTKSYVDNIAQGLSFKQPVRAASPGNVSQLSGTTTIDGVSVAAGDRVLLLGQTKTTDNGLWVVQSGAWTRPTDFAVGAHAQSVAVFVEQGATYAENGFTCINDNGTDTVGTDNLSFVQFTGLGEVLVSSGLVKSGNTISAVLATNSGLQFTSGAFDHFLNPQGALAKDGNGLKVQTAYAGTINATLSSDQNGLAVTGVPNKFNVAGVATNATVSAAGLNTLTGGTTSLADSQHQHQNVLSAQACVDYHSCSTALTAGDAVFWGASGSTLNRCDASSSNASRIIGIALVSAAANSTLAIVKRGLAVGVASGLTPSLPVFLNAGGGLTQTAPSGPGTSLVRVGYAVNANTVDVNPIFIGLRSM